MDTGTSELNAAYLLSAIGIGSCVTRITHGFIIDHRILNASVLTSLAYFVCGVSCILTPVSDEYPVLAVFAVLIGLSSGVYNSTIPTVAKEYVWTTSCFWWRGMDVARVWRWSSSWVIFNR